MKRTAGIIVLALIPIVHALGGDIDIQPSTEAPSINCPVDDSAVMKPPVPKRIHDAVPEKIAFGEIIVRAEEFVQLPKTEDIGVTPGRYGVAHARVHGLVQVPDRSGRLAIIDQRGKVYLADGRGHLTLYLDLIREDVSYYASYYPPEMGLMSIAFHPDFARRRKPGYGKLYTAYSASKNSGVADYQEDETKTHKSTVREWTASDPKSNKFKGTSRSVLRVGQIDGSHNIGRIAFNPTARKRRAPDYGMLYIGFADGSFGYDPHKNSQSLLSPLGGILRIDPLGGDDKRAYGIPDGNPFVGRDDALPEIWTYGNRNPQHLSWDRDGRLFFIDIGETKVEEVNLGVAGANYGWPLREGSFATGLAYEGGRLGPVYPLPECDVHDFVYPIAQYDHDEGRAISSGYVYRGKAIPALWGKYVFADLVRGRLFYINADDVEPGRLQTIYELRVNYDDKGSTLLDIVGPDYGTAHRVDLRLGRDNKGELYLLTESDGKVRRLVAVAE